MAGPSSGTTYIHRLVFFFYHVNIDSVLLFIRWCSTFPDYFAVTTNSTNKGAIIHVYNTGYLQAQPTVFNVAPRPLYVRDFDFLAEKGIPRIVAAVGRKVVMFYIGVES